MPSPLCEFNLGHLKMSFWYFIQSHPLAIASATIGYFTCNYINKPKNAWNKSYPLNKLCNACRLLNISSICDAAHTYKVLKQRYCSKTVSLDYLKGVYLQALLSFPVVVSTSHMSDQTGQCSVHITLGPCSSFISHRDKSLASPFWTTKIYSWWHTSAVK